MKKENNMKIQKSWIWNGSIIAALVAAIAIFIAMLQTEKNMLTEYEKGVIYVAARQIPKGELITEQNYTEYFEQKELDKNCIPETALSTPQQIEGLVALYEIEEGVFLTQGMFEERNQVIAQMQKPVIVGLKVDDLFQAVNGTLRAGDRIHIYNVDEEGIATLAWSDVFVEAVFDGSGTAISNEDALSSAQRMNIYMDKTDIERFYSDLATNSLRAVKVCD